MIYTMHTSTLDPSHGLRTEAQVRHIFGSSVTSSSPDSASSFWLLAAFSRSRLKLFDRSVADILQSILGGSSDSFAVVEVEEGIFKFSVISKHVGLFVYNLKFFECAIFKIFFHLWN